MMMRRVAPLALLLIVACSPAIAQVHDLTTLMPRPKEAFQLRQAGSFTLAAGVPVYIVATDDRPLARSAAHLAAGIAERLAFTPEIRTVGSLSALPAGPKIVVGVLDALATSPDPTILGMPTGGTLPGPEGYILHITPEMIVIAGSDPDGAFNGATTLLQLMNHAGASETIAPAHIMDYPDYPVRWVFSQHNLRGPGQLTRLREIIDTMARYKLNGIQQNDFKYQVLDEQPRYYFDSVDTFKHRAALASLEIIPGVAPLGYSEGILRHDPNLAEGFPATARYVIEGDTARLLPDPRVTLPNGSFESIDGKGGFTGWSFYDDGAVTPDHAVVHGGATSARCENFTAGNPAGNCRFNRRVDCQPNSYYHMSAWARTEGLSGTVQLLAIGTDDSGRSRTLTFTQFGMNGTNDWRKVEVLFNTLEFNHLLLYAGVWGGTKGKIWWDDFKVEEAGLVNVLRRRGTPLAVRSTRSGASFEEGADFEPVADAIMNGDLGYYGFHHPATLRRKVGGALANGDTVAVSFFHPLTTVSDESITGSVMACVSEDTLYTILHEQIAGVEELYGRYPELSSKPAPVRFFLGHDEIRAMNRDSACLRRGMGPAPLLADNLKRTVGIVEEVHPGARTYVWSDMFDSLHNAHDAYYLINGDLRGVWDSIPRTTTIVNWNGNRAASLKFFADRGFEQITSPYYDAGNDDGIRAWRLAMEGTPNVRGMMYTTWSADYDHLVPFAYYAWGAGPYIIHRPLDSSDYEIANDITCFQATVLPDPFDPTDSITKVEVSIDGRPPIPLEPRGDHMFHGCCPFIDGFTYQVVATNRQGLTRRTQAYTVHGGTAGIEVHASPALPRLAIRPNPARERATIEFGSAHGGRWELRLSDPLGRCAAMRDGECASGGGSIELDLAGLPSGLYRCELRTAAGATATLLRIVR